jgi:2-amino-4-hydroxy-6-hydroxymethyldihydropteridine diphosphokinase
MARAFVGVGSNIDPEANVQKALTLLAFQVRILNLSTFYRTEPENRPEQEPYFNGVVEIETSLSPVSLKRTILQAIEGRLGRKREADRYASRTIDLDLLLYDRLVMNEDGVILPDPDILERPYLAISLRELDPELILPGDGTPLARVWKEAPPDRMKPLEHFTTRLRKAILDGEQGGKD